MLTDKLVNNPITHIQDYLAHLSVYDILNGIIYLLIFLVLLKWLLRLLDLHRQLKQPVVYLELTPPAYKDQVPVATEQLYMVLHGLEKTRTYLEKLLDRTITMTAEVTATRDSGIRFVLRVPKEDKSVFLQNMHSYLPDVKIAQIKDYLRPKEGLRSKLLTFRQTNHWAYPLKPYNSLTQQDPIAYKVGSMTKLEPGEQLIYQLVISPARLPEAKRLDKKILANTDVREVIKPYHRASSTLGWLSVLIRLPFIVVGAVFHVLFSDHSHEQPAVVYRGNASSKAEQDLVMTLHDKLSQPLFRVSIRAFIQSTDAEREKQRVKGIRSALTAFDVPNHQSLQSKKALFGSLTQKYRLFMFRNRLPAMLHSRSNVLSSAELSGLFHFPHSSSAKTENVVKSLSKALPAPVSMKGSAKLDVILGANQYHGTTTPIGLTADQRERHTYIIGGTGNGKTTLLEFAIIQDMLAGKGLAFIDPHGDAAEKLLGYVPKDRLKDVVYLNPADIGYPIGINLLELPEGLSEDEYIMEKERVTEAVVSILRKVFADDEANAHRIEAMLRNAIRTAFYVEDATLFTILKLFRNQSFRNSVIAKLDDDDLKDFWREEFGKAGGMQRVSMSKGITLRLDRFRASAPVYRMFSQVKSTVSFEDIMNEGKILICNFSSEMGEDTSTLFGTTVLAKLKIAAERRKRIVPSERRPFHVYVDEFQNFATTPFTKMLSTARKYKLFLTIAEQSTTQQEEQRMVETILANVGTMITFRSGSPLDEQLMLARFRPSVEEGDIANLPAYNFYMRVAGLQTEEPMSGQTLLLDNEGNSKIADEVIVNSRRQFAKKYVDPKAKATKKLTSKRQTTDKDKNDNHQNQEPQKDEDEPVDA